MANLVANSALDGALAELETALLTPIISGELPQWCADAGAAAEALAKPLGDAIGSNHRVTLWEILREDPELATEVEKMQATDGELVVELRQLQAQLDRLRNAAQLVEPDEGRTDVIVEDVKASGLNLVLAVRRQETAITTYLLESLERDRGVVD